MEYNELLSTIQYFINWLYNPYIISHDTLLNNILRLIIVLIIIRVILSYVLRLFGIKYTVLDEIRSLPDELAEELVYGSSITAVLLLSVYVIAEELLYFGLPLYISIHLFGEYVYIIMILFGMIWSIMHVRLYKIIIFLPEGVLRAMLWLTGLWWLSILSHIINNIIALLYIKHKI